MRSTLSAAEKEGMISIYLSLRSGLVDATAKARQPVRSAATDRWQGAGSGGSNQTPRCQMITRIASTESKLSNSVGDLLPDPYHPGATPPAAGGLGGRNLECGHL